MIETARLTLRPPRAADFEMLHALTVAPDMRRYLGKGEPSRADSFARMQRNAGSWSLYGYGSFIVCERDSNITIGNCGVFHSYRDLGPDFDNHAEAGWIISHNQWGKGYAKEAMRAALAWFDRMFAAQTTVCMIETGNIASEKLAAKLGYTVMRSARFDGVSMHLYQRISPVTDTLDIGTNAL